MKLLEVQFLGRPLGRLAEIPAGIVFEYAPDFLASGIELSPLALPRRSGVLARGGSPQRRLPGLFEDSLPDAWGQRVLAAWFGARGTPVHAITPLMQLAYLGEHTLGALTYSPALPVESAASSSLDQIFTAAANLESKGEVDLATLAVVGSPAGGARPKAVLSLAPDASGRAFAGAPEEAPQGFVPSIVKFDPGDNELGVLEEAYAQLARAAGLDVPPSRLIKTHDPLSGRERRHFAVARFDRDAKRGRVHYHSLAGLLEMGGGDLDYRHLLRACRRLTRDEREVWKAYRQAVFNVLAHNRDDHGKNVGFVLREGEWALAPAFDLTPLSPAQLPERGMAVLGERRMAGETQLFALAEAEGLARTRAREVMAEVRTALGRWREFAEAAGVSPLRAAEWGRELAAMRSER